jgi:hypothetical protein
MQPVLKGSAMLSKRSNGNTRHAAGSEVADACFGAMLRHNERNAGPVSARPSEASSADAQPTGDGSKPAAMSPAREAEADIVYGARAIAKFIFGDPSNTARRRVFNLWIFHKQRKERAGFFKMKGGLCLSKSKWRAFHGLD